MKEDLLKNLPREFVNNTLDRYGEAGRLWLDNLPGIIAELEDRWGAIAGRPFLNLSYNYVANAALLDGKAAVLKIAPPINRDEISSEAAYLGLLNGQGVVRLLKFDEERAALLTERVAPGANLKSFCKKEPESAIGIAVDALKRVLRPAGPESEGFFKLDNWFEGLARSRQTAFPQAYARKALDLYRELTDKDSQLFLTHGDLHHENIISSYRERFLLIDPKGVLGHPGYDIGVFLNNHFWWLDDDTRVPARLDRAVKEFAGAFNMEEATVRKWAFCQMVLSWWWTFEEAEDASRLHGVPWSSMPALELGLSNIWNI